MKNQKTAISLTLIGLFAANIAFALPEFSIDAPQSSIDSCVAEVDNYAHLEDAKAVVHNVETKEREPLPACRRKDKPKACKSDFPRSKWLWETAVVLCQGMIKEMDMALTGRRSKL